MNFFKNKRKMNSRMLIATLVFVLSVTLNQVSGATWRGKGCGADRKNGDEWYPSGQCSKCHCYSDDVYSCYSCGAFYLPPKRGCYVDYENRSGQYPICCGKRYFCRGDPKFDSKKFDDYWKNDIIG